MVNFSYLRFATNNIEPLILLGSKGYSDYRHSFNGMECDEEMKDKGNSYTTHFRQYDPRLGRWLSIDPMPDASSTPYSSMDNNPIKYNDVRGNYTEKRAKRVRDRHSEKGYTVGTIYKNGDDKNDYGFSVWKGSSAGTGSYSAHMFNGCNFRASNDNFTSYNSSTYEFEPVNGFVGVSIQDILLASGGALASKGERLATTIVNSRSGFTSGKLNPGSAKVFNKVTAAGSAKILKVGGTALSIFSVISTEQLYDSGQITTARRNYNHVNSAIGTVAPGVGIPIAIGDYLGQKYHPQIEAAILDEDGIITITICHMLQLMGGQCTIYPQDCPHQD